MTKQTDLNASRIWRTVVFAGAMLGTPTVVAADSIPPQNAVKPAPAAKPNPAAPKPVTKPAPVDPAGDTAKRIAVLDTERRTLYAKLGTVALKDLDKLTWEIGAKNDAIRKLVDELVNLRQPRPRTLPEVRPTGRGFVLA